MSFLQRDPASNTTEIGSLDSDGTPVPPGTAERAKRRKRRRTALLLLTLTFAVVAVRPVPLLLMSPGPARPVTFENPPEEAGDTEGSWSFTTVAVTEISGFEWAIAQITGRSDDLVPKMGGDRADRYAADAAAMRTSKQTAWLVANRLIGNGEVGVANGATISAVAPDSPAANAAVPTGARITAINGEKISAASEVAEAIDAALGAAVTLEMFDGPETQRTISVTPERSDGKWRVGIEVRDSVDVEDPAFEPNSDGVGGPSAGMMFTLAYLDALSPGDLTGGRHIAGTGTIAADGTVGPVGGTPHKVEGAEREGADVFFVDERDARAASAAASTVDVVQVKGIEAAVDWLCRHGATDAVCATR